LYEEVDYDYNDGRTSKFLILDIQLGGRICTKTLQTHLL